MEWGNLRPEFWAKSPTLSTYPFYLFFVALAD